jgi:hypothetical protein
VSYHTWALSRFAPGRDARSTHQYTIANRDGPASYHSILHIFVSYASARQNRCGNARSSNSHRLSPGDPSGRIDASRFKHAHISCRALLVFVSIRGKADCRNLLLEDEERVYTGTIYKNNNPSETLVARIPSFWPCSAEAWLLAASRPPVSPISVVARFIPLTMLRKLQFLADPLWLDLSPGLGQASQSVACVERHDGCTSRPGPALRVF